MNLFSFSYPTMTRIFVSALALIGASTATAAAATFTAKVQVPSKLLDIRGGAGPLDPTTAAKVRIFTEDA